MEIIKGLLSKLKEGTPEAIEDSSYQIIRLPIKTSILMEFIPAMLERELEVHQESQNTTQEPSE
jgi:hypothetical protein